MHCTCPLFLQNGIFTQPRVDCDPRKDRLRRLTRAPSPIHWPISRQYRRRRELGRCARKAPIEKLPMNSHQLFLAPVPRSVVLVVEIPPRVKAWFAPGGIIRRRAALTALCLFYACESTRVQKSGLQRIDWRAPAPGRTSATNPVNVACRECAMSFRWLQNGSSRLMLVLRPSTMMECLTTKDFIRAPQCPRIKIRHILNREG